MNNIMKKAAMLALAVIATATVSAQSQPMSVGGGLVFGSGDGFSNTGIQAKYRLGLTSAIRAEGGFTYFLKKDEIGMWDVSANAHYLFPVADKLTVYPLAGISMLGVSYPSFDIDWDSWDVSEDTQTDTEFGFNIGAGVDYDLTDALGLNAEFKYRIGSDWGRTVFSIGVFYKF
jgi:opacity protein-like surface antigen